MGRTNYPIGGLGQRIALARARKGLQQVDIINATGLHKSVIYRIESGDTPDPSFGVVAKIADALGVSLDELAGRRTVVDSPSRRVEVGGHRTTAQKRKVDMVDHPYTHVLVTRQKTTTRQRKAG